MNVTQLKQKLAALEAQGYGELDIVKMEWDSEWNDFNVRGLEEVEVDEETHEIKLY